MMARKMLAPCLLSLLLINPLARAGYSSGTCYNIASFNSSRYYGSSASIYPCGNDVYNTCCEIGDYCIEGGFCESGSTYYSSSSSSVYYLGGCTDSSGEDPEACGGYCPRGRFSDSSGSSSSSSYYSYLVWQSAQEEWMCCPSTASSASSCVLPVAADGISAIENENSFPSDLVRTASVVGSSSFYSYGFGGYNPTASSSSYYGYSYPTSTGYGYGSGGYGSGSSPNYDYDDNPFGFSTTLLVIVIVVPVLVGSFLIALLIWLIVHKCRKADRKAAIPVMPGNPSQWPLPQGQVVYPYVMAGSGQSAAEAQREYEQKMAAAGWVARQPPQVASAQQQGQAPEMSQVAGQEGPIQPVPAAAAAAAAATTTTAAAEAPRGGSRALSPAGSHASWLPPIQEVAPIDKQEIDAAAAVPTPSAEEPAREVAERDATAAAAAAPTTASHAAGAESEGTGSSWPLGPSSAENAQHAGSSTVADAAGSGAADHAAASDPAPRRSGDLYD